MDNQELVEKILESSPSVMLIKGYFEFYNKYQIIVEDKWNLEAININNPNDFLLKIYNDIYGKKLI